MKQEPLNQQMDLEQYIAELIKSTPRCLTCGQKVNPFFEQPYCSEDCELGQND